MDIKNLNFVPEPIIQRTPSTGKAPRPKSNNNFVESFQTVLIREQASKNALKVSAHAQQRLIDRNIKLDKQDWAKINNAIDKAEAKGASNSLLIHGNLALLVSVKNRTVISAMDDTAMQDHVFTNIDSAVIVK